MIVRKAELYISEEQRSYIEIIGEAVVSDIKSLSKPQDVFEVMNSVFQLNKRAEECVVLITLNNKNVPICVFEVNRGTVNQSVVGVREILVRALLCGATSIILSHNHPSGDPSPSKQDMDITKKLNKACELVGIRMLDHVIAGNNSFFSFTEAKVL